MAVVRRVMLLCILLPAVFSIPEKFAQANPVDNNVNHKSYVGQQHQDIHEHVQPQRIRHAPMKIAEHPACSADVKQLCSPNLATNNFAVLECLQNDEKVNILVTVTTCVFVGPYVMYRSCIL